MQGGNEDQQHNPTAIQVGDQFQPGDSPGQTAAADNQQSQADAGAVTWEASEYIHHDKGTMWYLALFGGVILLAAALYLLLKDIFAVTVVVIMGVAVAVVAGRKPSVRRYSLSHDGLTIGDRHYDLGTFRSFTLLEGPVGSSVSLWPTKRFTPPLAIYFEPADGERIVDILGATLPYEERQPDVVDRLLERIRF